MDAVELRGLIEELVSTQVDGEIAKLRARHPSLFKAFTQSEAFKATVAGATVERALSDARMQQLMDQGASAEREANAVARIAEIAAGVIKSVVGMA